MIGNLNIKGVEDVNVLLDFLEIFWICFWGSEYKFFNFLLCVICLYFVDGWFFIEFLVVWKCRLGVLYMYMYIVSENIYFMCRVINIVMYKMIYFFIWKNVIKYVYYFVIIVWYMMWLLSFIYLKKRNNVYISL